MESNVRITKDSNEFYHSQKQYISSSMLKTIAKKSVCHYLREDPPFGSALTIGSAFHTLVLEPHLFDDEFMVIKQKIDRRTKVGKAEMARLEGLAASKNQDILLGKDHDMIQAMSHSIDQNEIYKHFLDECKKEVSFYVDDFRIPDFEHTFRVRVRPDAYSSASINYSFGDKVHFHDNVIIDLKSCQDASPRGFKSSVYNFGWHIQAAYYLDVLTHVAKSKGNDVPFTDFFFLAVEKKSPYSAQMYCLPEALLEEGRRKYRSALKMWHHYLMTNEELGYHDSDGVSGPVITL